MLAPNTAPYEFMSPTLLSKQPAQGKPDPKQSSYTWLTFFPYLESRMNSLRNWRYSWWAYWSVLARFFIPRRYIWLVVANRMWRGSPLNDAIIDSTGQLAVRTCRSGMWTGLTSPSRPWFKMAIALPWVQVDAEAQAWLEDTEKRIYTVLEQSNFYDRMAQLFEDLVVFGTSPIIIYEDFEDVVRFYLPCAGEYYLANGARMAVNTFFREFTLSVQQIVDMFTLDSCPEQVQKLWQAGDGASLDTEYVVCHSIEPNFPLQKRGRVKGDARIVPEGFTWREVYWLKGVKTMRPLSKKGFHGQPFAAFRWATVQNDAYGRGPCMDGLGDNKQTQTETLRKGEFLEKGVRPPMGADPSLKNEPASVMPAMITYFSTDGGKKGFFPLFKVDPAWLTAITADIASVNARLEKCLFVDLFMAISRMEGVQPRNELELTKRDLERLQELGPVINLAEKELDIIITRIMEILMRRGMLGKKPQSLMNVPLKIKYTSILRLAQLAAESIAMKDGFQTGGELSSAAKAAGLPDPLRIINLDKAYREYLEANGFPMQALFTDDQVKQHDQIRQKAMQQAQAPGQAMAAVDAAKTLSDTQLPGGNSALGAMLGSQGGGGATAAP
jgi:hypothetical protein